MTEQEREVPYKAPSALKHSRVLAAFLNEPLRSKEDIAAQCGVSRATAFRIIRSYRHRTRYRTFAHGNTAAAKAYREISGYVGTVPRMPKH